MTAKDWLVEINKWLKRNGYKTYDMRKMTKKQWGILHIGIQKIGSMDTLKEILEKCKEKTILDRVDLLSTYMIACIDGMKKKIEEEKEMKKKKEKIQTEALENVRKWEKEKRENPDKFGIPENLLDRFK